MGAPLPSPASLAHRARLAALISPLRPTRFRAPFTRLLAHRIPTLWTLYRGIMRDAPTETLVKIRSRMRTFFRVRKGMRVQGEIARELSKAHKWWGIFRKAQEGDTYLKAVCARYSRMLEGARAQVIADRAYAEEMAWRERMRTRPIMTGGFIKPTLYNGPLPRLSPQPAHISGMITARRKARARRMVAWGELLEQIKLLDTEAQFERTLTLEAVKSDSIVEPVFSDTASWRKPINELMSDIHESFEREKTRAMSPFPPEMIAAVKEARREKIRNKTRERERERRGEVTRRLLRRMRQGPPAHVLTKMSEEERRMDRIARGASEVGYVGEVKRALGYKLRDPDGWKVELGKPENREALGAIAAEIEEVNVRRRTQDD